jgi:DNA primase
VGLPVTDLVRLAERGVRRPSIEVKSKRSSGPMENAEFAALVLLVQEWDSIAEWLIEALFDDDANRMAFRALAEAGDLNGALDVVAPDAREVLERAAVADIERDAFVEAKSLIGSAMRRELQARKSMTDPDEIRETTQLRLDVEALQGIDDERALAAAESLLGWLDRRIAEHTGGDTAHAG